MRFDFDLAYAMPPVLQPDEAEVFSVRSFALAGKVGYFILDSLSEPGVQ